MSRIEAEVGTPKGGFMKWIDDRFPFTEDDALPRH